MSIESDFQKLLQAARIWAENHMDQWERFKFESRCGTIYVSIALSDPHPDTFERVKDDAR